MRAATLILALLLAPAALAATPGGLSVVPRSFDYEINHPRGATVPLRIDIENDGEDREAWVLVVVHAASTGEDIELYSEPRVIPAGARARFDAADGLSVRLHSDGVYSLTAIVFTAGPAGDLRADTVHELRPLYVGATQRTTCHK